MDVHEKGIRLPASNFLDGDGVNTIQVHGHRSTCTEGMTADIIWFVAKVVKTNLFGRLLQSLVDVVCCNLLPCCKHGVTVVEDSGFCIAPILKDVMDTPCQRFDGTVVIARALLVYALAFDAILLIWNADGCFVGCVEDMKWGGAGDKTAFFGSEGDIFDSKGLCVGFIATGSCVFSNTQQVVEGNVAQISFGFSKGTVAMCCTEPPVLVKKVLNQGDWDSKLWGGLGILSPIGIQDLLQGLPVVLIRIRLVGRVWSESQFEDLANGAKRILN